MSNPQQEFGKLTGELIRVIGMGLDKSNSNASGRLKKSFEAVDSNVPDADSMAADIMANAYWFYRDKGRGASKSGGGGKGNLFEQIKQWIMDKGIQSDIPINSLAFLITRKIHRQGYKGNNTITGSVNEFVQKPGQFDAFTDAVISLYFNAKTETI